MWMMWKISPNSPSSLTPPVEIIIKNLACILDLFPKYLSTVCIQVHVNGLRKQNHYELFSLLFPCNKGVLEIFPFRTWRSLSFFFMAVYYSIELTKHSLFN